MITVSAFAKLTLSPFGDTFGGSLPCRNKLCIMLCRFCRKGSDIADCVAFELRSSIMFFRRTSVRSVFVSCIEIFGACFELFSLPLSDYTSCC